MNSEHEITTQRFWGIVADRAQGALKRVHTSPNYKPEYYGYQTDTILSPIEADLKRIVEVNQAAEEGKRMPDVQLVCALLLRNRDKLSDEQLKKAKREFTDTLRLEVRSCRRDAFHRLNILQSIGLLMYARGISKVAKSISFDR